MPTPKAGYTNAAGAQVPGCTTILAALSGGSNDPLLAWAARLAEQGIDWRQARERAAQVGTWIHDALEHYPDPIPARPMWMTDEEWTKAQVAYEGYGHWFAAIRPTVIVKEVQLVSEEHQAGGTPDAIHEIGSGKVIVDHKTGKTVDLCKVAAQLGFYAAAAKEKLGHNIERGLVLHYTAKGLKPIELSQQQLAAGLDLFRTARKAYSQFKTFPRA